MMPSLLERHWWHYRERIGDREMTERRPQFPANQNLEKSRRDLIDRIENHLQVTSRGFHLSYVSQTSNKVIFDSKWCRFKVYLYGGRYPMPSEEELYISYGRLHAPDEEPYMMWNDQECHCWHDIRFLCLFFLEGYSPQDIDSEYSSVPFENEYQESEHGSQLRKDNPAEFGFRLQSLIWERYGQRLFELFDLRHPDLWQQYQEFLAEYYKLKNWQPLPLGKGMSSPVPSPWMIC